MLQFLAARDAERAECLGNAIFKHLLQTIPSIGGAFFDLRNCGLDHAADFLNLRASELARCFFQRSAFLDQRFVELAALFLRLGKRAETGQPDLFGLFHYCFGRRLQRGVAFSILEFGLEF